MKMLSLCKRATAGTPDSLIIRRVLDGDKELFEILLRRYNQTLYRAIRSYVRLEDDVEDLMQDTYIKAYQKLEHFKEDASFSTWLVRIGINEALQHIRKKERIPGANRPGEPSAKIIELSDSEQMNPEKRAIKHEMGLMVEKAIDRLHEKYKIVFMLHEVEGMANPEIAACLGLSDSNVKVRLHRARNLIKEELYKLSSDASVFEFGNSRCDRVVDYVMDRI